MACYIKVKLIPLGLFSKKILTTAISSRPSTCLAALKAHEPCEIIPQYNYSDEEDINTNITSFDHTNKNVTSNWLQVHFQLHKTPETTTGAIKANLVTLQSGKDIKETDKLEIVNYLQSCSQIRSWENYQSPRDLAQPVIEHLVPCIPQESLPTHIYSLELNPNLIQPETLHYASAKSTQSETKDFPGKPSNEQLTKIFNALSESIPKFFTTSHNFFLYNKNIVFKNGIRGVTTRGLTEYIKHIAWVKILCHFRYAHVKMTVLKITKHEEDGTIRVRWRINGVSGIRAFLFWNFKVWQLRKNISVESDWIDGFSVFHVGSDGLIYEHVCDKMMPDETRDPAIAGNVGLKLAMMIGITPTAGNMLGDFSICSSQNT